MAAFLNSSEGTLPRRFAPSPLNFVFGATQPTPASIATIDELAGVLRSHPSARIRVLSHTDATGTPEANQTLSTARSETIKSMLVARGADAANIAVGGMGQEEPRATNDTGQGRAENRRTEIVVTDR